MQNDTTQAPVIINQKILQALIACKQKNIPFYQAKQILVKAGWSEQEINLVTVEFPYDNLGDDTDVAMREYYLRHPGESKVLSDDIEQQQRDEAIMGAVADTLAASYGPDIESRTFYRNKFLHHDVNMSWWQWIAINVGFIVLLFTIRDQFHIPYPIVDFISIVLSVTIIGYLIWKRAGRA